MTACIYSTARTFVASVEGVVPMVVRNPTLCDIYSRESLRYWVSSHFGFKETLAIVCSLLASKVASKVRAVLCMHTAMLTRCYGLTSSPLSTACPFPSLLFPLPSFSFQSRAPLLKTMQITHWWVHKMKTTLWRDGLDMYNVLYIS